MKSVIWGLAAVSIFVGQTIATTPVTLRLHFGGPSGPVVGLPLGIQYAVSGYRKRIQSETDLNGEAEIALDRDIGSGVIVMRSSFTRAATESLEQYMARSAAVEATFDNLAIPLPFVVELPLAQAVVEKSVQVPAGVSARAHLVVPSGMSVENPSLRIPGASLRSEYVSATGVLTKKGVRAEYGTPGFVTWFDREDIGRVMRILVPSSAVEINFGDIVLPLVNYDATIRISHAEEQPEWPLRALASAKGAGCTFISSNATSIFTIPYSSGTEVGSGTPCIEVCPIPAGTYYLCPGAFSPTDFQLILIEKLAAGIDLSSNSAIPHVTVIAGETKDITFNALGAINAIYALP